MSTPRAPGEGVGASGGKSEMQCLSSNFKFQWAASDASSGQVLQTLCVMYRCSSRVLAEPEENFVHRVERLLDNELVRFVISQQQQLSAKNQATGSMMLAESMIFKDARTGNIRSRSKGHIQEREQREIDEDSDHEDMDVLSNAGARPGNWSSEISRTSSGDSAERRNGDEPQRVLKAPFFRSWEDFMEFDNNFKHKIPITQSDFSLLLEKEAQNMQGWDMCVDRKEIKVAKTLQSDGGGCIFLRAWSSLPDVELPVVFHMFYQCEKRMEWDRAFFDMKVLDQIEGSDILYSVLRVPACTPRDYVQYRRVKVLEDGSILISLRSAIHPDMPEKNGYIRAESFTSGYVMRRYDDGKEKGTKVFLMTMTDVKGIIPKWMINFVAPRKPGEWIDSLKRACLDYQNANPDYPKLEKDLEPFKHNHPFDYEDMTLDTSLAGDLATRKQSPSAGAGDFADDPVIAFKRTLCPSPRHKAVQKAMAEEEAAEVPPEPVPPLTEAFLQCFKAKASDSAEEELEARAAIFEELFKDHPALEVKQKSMAERKEKEAPPPREEGEDAPEVVEVPEPNIALAYSELSFSVMDRFVNLVKEKCGPLFPNRGVFLDLGSGAGKNCLAAALLHPFQKIIGVETLQSLNDVEAAVQAKFAEVELPEGMTKPELSFVKGDFVAEFDSVLEAIAPEVTFAVVVATTFGDPEMQAVAKLAQKMPEGACLMTVTQKLEDALVVDVNREPRKRRALATRKALAQRGTEPKGIEIELEAAENDPNGWRLKHSDSLELEWGTTSCYLYKKYTYPFCDVGDICMATPLPEIEDQTVAPAYFLGPAKVRYMDDLAEKEVEVSKVSPFCEESRKKAVKLFLQKVEAAKAKAAQTDDLAAQALATVRQEVETFAADGKLPYKLEEESPTLALLSHLTSAYGLPEDEKVNAFAGERWIAACEELDPDATGAIAEDQLVPVWQKDHKASTALMPLLEVPVRASSEVTDLVTLGSSALALQRDGTLLIHDLSGSYAETFRLQLPADHGARWLGLCPAGGREMLLVGSVHHGKELAVWRMSLPLWM
ncbi:Stard7 [Symbiodinium sp. KB8]|nr:Stard7 [Symbiodinium sp. KB8]